MSNGVEQSSLWFQNVHIVVPGGRETGALNSDGEGTEKVAQQFRSLASLLKSPRLVPSTHTECLTAASSSSFGGSDTLF